MIASTGWCTWATVIPGIPGKVYSQPNSGTGFACHSIVGSTQAALNRFLDTSTMSDGRYTPYAAASCVFILSKDGTLIQMYPITASTWTSGGREANTSFIPMELEGGGYHPDGTPNFSEPMTDAQVATFVRLIRELEAHKGIRYKPGDNMLEHRHIANRFGYAPTACASGRYGRGWVALFIPPEEDMGMTLEEKARLTQAENTIATLNDLLVIERDLQRSINPPHPGVWRAHKLLKESGLLIQPEYAGDYRGYA